MKYVEISSNDFWKQVFCSSDNFIQPVIIENSNFQHEIAIKIKTPLHVAGCDTIFMEDEIVIVDIKKQKLKEIMPLKQIKIIEPINDIAIALTKVEEYNKKNHIINLRKKFNIDKKSRF